MPSARDQRGHLLSTRRSSAVWKSPRRGSETLEDENAKLKKLLTEAILNNAVLKNLASKNGNTRR